MLSSSRVKDEEEKLIKDRERLRDLCGPEHPDHATAAVALGELYLNHHGRYGQAEALFSEAKDILERANAHTKPEFEVTLRRLAQAQTLIGHYDEAVKTLMELRYLEAKESRARVEIDFWLAQTQRRQGRPDVALRTLASYEALGSRWSVATARIMEDLGRGQDAVLMRLQQDSESAPGRSSNSHALGLAYLQAGKLAEAESHLAALLEERRAQFGDQEPLVAEAAANLAEVKALLGKCEEALQLLKGALPKSMEKQAKYTVSLRGCPNKGGCDAEVQFQRAMILGRIVAVLQQVGCWEESRSPAEEARALLAQLRTDPFANIPGDLLDQERGCALMRCAFVKVWDAAYEEAMELLTEIAQGHIPSILQQRLRAIIDAKLGTGRKIFDHTGGMYLQCTCHHAISSVVGRSVLAVLSKARQIGKTSNDREAALDSFDRQLAFCRIDHGKPSEAENFHQKFHGRTSAGDVNNGQHWSLLLGQAEHALRTGKVKEARSCMTEMYKQKPNDVEALHFMAAVTAFDGQPLWAEDLFARFHLNSAKEAYEAGFLHVAARLNERIVRCKAALGLYEEALELVKWTSGSDNRGERNRLLFLGSLLRRLGRFTEAQKVYEEMLEKSFQPAEVTAHPQRAAALIGLACVFLGCGRRDEAWRQLCAAGSVYAASAEALLPVALARDRQRFLAALQFHLDIVLGLDIRSSISKVFEKAPGSAMKALALREREQLAVVCALRRVAVGDLRSLKGFVGQPDAEMVTAALHPGFAPLDDAAELAPPSWLLAPPPSREMMAPDLPDKTALVLFCSSSAVEPQALQQSESVESSYSAFVQVGECIRRIDLGSQAEIDDAIWRMLCAHHEQSVHGNKTSALHDLLRNRIWAPILQAIRELSLKFFAESLPRVLFWCPCKALTWMPLELLAGSLPLTVKHIAAPGRISLEGTRRRLGKEQYGPPVIFCDVQASPGSTDGTSCDSVASPPAFSPPPPMLSRALHPVNSVVLDENVRASIPHPTKQAAEMLSLPQSATKASSGDSPRALQPAALQDLIQDSCQEITHIQGIWSAAGAPPVDIVFPGHRPVSSGFWRPAMVHVMCGDAFLEAQEQSMLSNEMTKDATTRMARTRNVSVSDLDGTQLVLLQGCEATKPVKRIGPLGALTVPGEQVLADGDSLLRLVTRLLDANVASVIVCLSKVQAEIRIPFLFDFYERILRGDSRRKALAGAQACAGICCYELYGEEGPVVMPWTGCMNGQEICEPVDCGTSSNWNLHCGICKTSNDVRGRPERSKRPQSCWIS